MYLYCNAEQMVTKTRMRDFSGGNSCSQVWRCQSKRKRCRKLLCARRASAVPEPCVGWICAVLRERKHSSCLSAWIPTVFYTKPIFNPGAGTKIVIRAGPQQIYTRKKLWFFSPVDVLQPFGWRLVEPTGLAKNAYFHKILAKNIGLLFAVGPWFYGIVFALGKSNVYQNPLKIGSILLNNLYLLFISKLWS